MQKIKTVFIFLLFFIFLSCKTKKENILAPNTEIIFSGNPVQVVENCSEEVNEIQGNNAHKDLEQIKPDIDLTVMSSTMIQSTVFQFLIDWESYVGNIIKIRGIYTPFFRQETGRLYHNVVVQDATACCKEGLEFVCKEAVSSDFSYPEAGKELIVTGVFEQYYEDDKMEVMQIRLNNAVMEIVG